jgi:hypothetical protein
MILLWLLCSCATVLVLGYLLGYIAGKQDGREERAREEWRDLR